MGESTGGLEAFLGAAVSMRLIGLVL
jgi:hypothetical protein